MDTTRSRTWHPQPRIDAPTPVALHGRIRRGARFASVFPLVASSERAVGVTVPLGENAYTLFQGYARPAEERGEEEAEQSRVLSVVTVGTRPRCTR